MFFKRVRNIYLRNMYTGIWVPFVFRFSPTTVSALTCNIWQNTYEPLFLKTREYPCIGYVIFHPIEYIRTLLFQVEVTSVTSVQRPEWNETETVALLFSRLDYTRLKGTIQLDFKPFYFV